MDPDTVDAVIEDAWPLNGPYTAEATTSAAHAAAELVRYLNYATWGAAPDGTAPGLPAPPDTDAVVAAVGVLVSRLPQILNQVAVLLGSLASGNTRLAADEMASASPRITALTAAAELTEAARLLAGPVSDRLNAARSNTARLYLTAPDETP